MNKKAWLLFLMVCCSICFSNVVFAETYVQKDGLFTIDIPEKWTVAEKKDEVSIVTIYNPEKNNGVSIQFAPENVRPEDVENRLNNACNIMLNNIKQRDGFVLDIETLQIGNAPARRINFAIHTSSGVNNASQLLILYKGYKFTITYGSRDDKEMTLMFDAVKTFKFKI